MLTIYRKVFALLTPPERRQFGMLFLMVVGVGLFEVVGVASILPFLAVIADPAAVTQNPRLAALYAASGATTPNGFLLAVGGVVFFLVVFGLAFKAYAFHRLFAFTSGRIHSLSVRLMEGYLSRPYVWHLRHNSADLGKNMLSEVDRVVSNVLVHAMRFMAQAVVVASLVALLVIAEPVVALGAGALLGGGYAGAFWLARRGVRRNGAEQVASNAERFRVATEAFGGVKDVKGLGLEAVYLDRFSRPAARFSAAETYALTLIELPRHLLEAVAFGGMLLLVLALLTGDDAAGLKDILPMLGLFAFAGVRLFPATQQLYGSFTKLRFGAASLDALHRTLMEATGPGGEPIAPPGEPPRLRERLELRDLRFAFPGAEREALAGLSLAIPARATVGLVGGTGAGKTTAVDVLLGLLEPTAGALVVDGTPVEGEARRAWRRAVGYVPQQIFLSDDSVAANIAFGQPAGAIDMAAVERAARIAELHDFVTTQMPQRYATMVGERGVRLSGGQRQRIGIARALYRDPDVLILDEATSALDNLTERAVMDAMRNLGRRKTVIMVAHRLSTVRDVDRIFLIEGGRVAAEGSYGELFERDARFRALATAGHGDPAAC
jgi:ABC-type multidrug transport system fused ATPase/permease subunit